MAVAYRSSTKGSNTWGSADLTLTEPSGAASGDYLIMAVWRFDGSVDDVTMHSDWTEISQLNHSGGTTKEGSQHVWYHERGGSAPTNFTITKNGSCSLSAVCFAVSGAAAGQVPQVSVEMSQGDVTSLTCTIDSEDTDLLVLGFHGTNEGSGAAADFDATMTEVQDNGNVENNFHGPTLGGYDDPAATGAQTYTHDGPNNSVYWAGLCALYGTALDYSSGDNGYVVSWSTERDEDYASADLEVPEPAGAAEDDIFVALIATTEGSDAAPTPTGWTSLATGALGTDGDYRIVYITRGASAPELTFSRTGSQGIAVHIACIRGCTTTGIDSDVATGTGTSLTTTAVDCSADGAVLAFYQIAESSALTEQMDVTTSGFRLQCSAMNDASFGMSAGAHLVGAAPTSTQTVTWTRTGSTGPNGAAALVFLPAAASGDATATPAAVAATLTIPAATPAAGSSVSPAANTMTLTIPAVTATGNAAVTPAAIAATLTIPAATPAAGSTASPAANTLTLTIPAATAGAGATASPAAIAQTLTIPAATPAAGATASPAAVAATLTIPAATPAAGSTVSPAAVAVTLTLPAATASASGDATATPAAIATTLTIPAATPAAGATVSPAAVAATLTIPAATVGGGAGASPAAVAVTLTIPAATPAAGATVSPAAVAATLTIPAAAASATSPNATASPATISVTFTIPAVSASVPAAAYVWIDQNQRTPPLEYRYPFHRTPADQLARFRAGIRRDPNVWILTDNTVTTRQPADMSTVSRVVHGGHDVPDDLTTAETTLLVDAGYIEEA